MRLRLTVGPAAAVGLMAVLGSSVAQTASSPRAAGRPDPLAVNDAARRTRTTPVEALADRRLGRGVAFPDGIAARLAGHDGRVAVMIELVQEPTVVAYGRARRGASGADAESAAMAAAQSQLASVEAAQASLLSALSRTSAEVLYRTQRVYNGVAVRANVREIAQLRRLPGVKAVHVLVPQYPTNWNSVPFVGAPTAWTKGLGYAGQGIKVGVIDTGIDYLHANFGGPGAAANYAANDTTVAGDTPNYPGVKVAGGHDFAGDAYTGGNTPVPDDDPMDCNGHGSHVAGTVGGYGVNGDGTTFNGSYGPGTHFDTLRIGPGVAPRVTLYGLRVFGCAGSTNLTTNALDWAVDPNGDGDFSDHLDVVNMSLGSNFGGPADPSAVASDNAVLAGTIVVASAGNAGDTYYITGAPAAAGRAVSVAASLDKAAVLSGFRVNAPAALQGVRPATEAAFGRNLNAGDVPGDLAISVPANGCTAISGVTGKIALIDRGVCSFKTKVRNAELAGALGVLITNNVPGFPVTMGDDPAVANPAISSMMTDQTNGNALRTALGTNIVNVTLTAALRERVASVQPAVQDTIASFSSRGASRLGSALKPDVDSVGESVFSTEALSGTEGDSFNGTSMSSPHVAGTMAILRQIHPTWTVEELKALVMNTANHNLFLGVGPVLPNIGPGRVGAGRQDVTAAVNTNVVAYNGDGSGRVSVSFGSVEVAGTTTLSKAIKVANKGKSSVTYTVAYNGLNMPDVPGVAFTTSVGSVSVAPGTTASFNVILTANAASMKHSRDASVASAQATAIGAFSRHFLSEEAGYVTLTPSTGPVLRVPVYAAARPVSAMGTTQTGIDISTGGNTGSRTLNLSGTGINTGSSFSTASPFPGQDEVSLVSLFELQDESDELEPGAGIDDSGDLRYVGVAKTSDAFGTIINFGIAAYGDWSSANANDTEFDIFIDADRDGTDDFALFNWNVGSVTASGTQDNLFSMLVDLSTNDLFIERRINGLSPTTRDTVTFNNRVMALGVYAEDMGITGSFDYYIVSFTRELGFVDVSDLHTWNVGAPGLNASVGAHHSPLGAPTWDDLPGNTINVAYDRDAYNAAGSLGLLLLHHHNAAGTQAQVLPVTSAAPAKGDFNGDGKTDLLWRDQGGTGSIGVWFMDGVTRTGSSATTPPAFSLLSWEIVGQGDFNADGKPDLLWRDQGNTGHIAVWYMDGVTLTSSTLVTPSPFAALSWVIAGVADFNSDGKPDILWRDQGNTGHIGVWFMDGVTMTGSALITPSPFAALGWHIVGVADFNADGKPDLLWRDEASSGSLGVWYLDGTVRIGSASLNPSSFPMLNWKIQAVGDYNQDGKPDLVWRDQGVTGSIGVWFMDGVTRTGSAATNPPAFPALSWRIVGPK